MNFADMTTDDLLAALPAAEDNRWEFKSASVLANKEHLKKVLGKQISAFANSGGGFLVFGVSDDRQIEPCPSQNGRQSMKDYLSTLVEQSVEYPLQTFAAHRIPLTDDPERSVFIIVIDDSPSAPHQSKDERQYYWRLDGHSKPAPHFHLELLRSRTTKAILTIDELDYDFQTPEFDGQFPRLTVAIKVKVKNISLQSATSWGVQVRMPRENLRWTGGRFYEPLHDGICVHGEQSILLPGERSGVVVHVRASSEYIGMQPILAYEKLWENFGVVVRPVSQDGIGEEEFLGWNNTGEWLQGLERLRRSFRR